MHEIQLGLVIFGVLLLLLLTGMPIAFALGTLGSIVFIVGAGGSLSALPALGSLPYSAIADFVLVALPMYVFMSELLVQGRFSDELYDCAYKWFGRAPGGLACGTTLGCGVFAALCGSSTATAAAIGRVAIPEMEKRNYQTRLIAGTVAAGGAIGILIPPSMPMILYGALTGVSVGQLFIAGVIPGVLQVLIFIVYILSITSLNPGIAPAIAARVSWLERVKALRFVLPLLFVIFMVLGTIYTGIATPTEAAGLGSAGALILNIAYRRLTWRGLLEALLGAVRITCMILAVAVGAVLYGYALSMVEIPQTITRWVVSLSVNPWLVMMMINLLWFFLGMFLDVIAIIYLTVPLLYPIVVSLGFDPIWFGVIMVINMEMAVITPPVGMNVYVIHGVAPNIKLIDIFRGVIPFLILEIGLLLLCMVFPKLILWLPSQMK